MIDVQILIVCLAALAGSAIYCTWLREQLHRLEHKLEQEHSMACEYEKLCKKKDELLKVLQAKTDEQEAYVNEIKAIMEYGDAE